MRAILGGLALAAAVALPGCQYCVKGAEPHPVTAQPLGARCARAGDCASGLTCTSLTCTISCATSPSVCPAGAVCAESIRDSRGNPLLVCLPACTSEADCLMGATVGTCLGTAGYCMPRRCTTDGDCGGAGRCVGVSEARGITWNEYCEDGFCQT